MRYFVPAALMLCLGTLLLLWCVREFYLAGRGTLAPWEAPRHLVTSGPYRVSRNPMYIGVVTILAGWCLLWGSRTLIIYLMSFAIGFHLRVLVYEEPWAARRFGPQMRRIPGPRPTLGHLAVLPGLAMGACVWTLP